MNSIEERLENWGRYHRGRQGSGGGSPTYAVCLALAVAHGKTIGGGYRELNPAPEVDESDAQIIEWCWGNSAYRMDRKHHALLPMHYVKNMDPRTTCRALKIRRYSYDHELKQAVTRFGDVVHLLTSPERYYNVGTQSERSAKLV